jgi:hypothetical protein
MNYTCTQAHNTATVILARCSIVLFTVTVKHTERKWRTLNNAGRYKVLLSLFVLSLLSGCHNVRQPVSKLDPANPATSDQLLSGFWWVESDSWRWTSREFSVALQPPERAEVNGATLYLHLFIPDSQIELLGPMTLTATVEGQSLPPETFSQGGPYVYTRAIPKELMATSILPIKFSFDKALSPAKADGRELAAIVNGIELQAE